MAFLDNFRTGIRNYGDEIRSSWNDRIANIRGGGSGGMTDLYNQQPQTNTGGASPSASTGGKPTESPRGTSSGNWTNLQRYIDVNAPRAGMLADQARAGFEAKSNELGGRAQDLQSQYGDYARGLESEAADMRQNILDQRSNIAGLESQTRTAPIETLYRPNDQISYLPGINDYLVQLPMSQPGHGGEQSAYDLEGYVANMFSNEPTYTDEMGQALLTGLQPQAITNPYYTDYQQNLQSLADARSGLDTLMQSAQTQQDAMSTLPQTASAWAPAAATGIQSDYDRLLADIGNINTQEGRMNILGGGDGSMTLGENLLNQYLLQTSDPAQMALRNLQEAPPDPGLEGILNDPSLAPSLNYIPPTDQRPLLI